MQFAKADADRAMQLIEEKKLDIEHQNLKAQVEMTNHFAKTVGKTEFTEAIHAWLKEKQKERGEPEVGIGKDYGKFAPGQMTSEFSKLNALIDENREKSLTAYNERIMSISGTRDAQDKLYNTQIAGNTQLIEKTEERQALETKLADMKREDQLSELQNQITLIDKKRTGLYQEFAGIDAVEKAQLDSYNREAEAAQALRDEKHKQIDWERDYFRQFTSDVSRMFSSELSGAFNSFFNDVAQGKGVLDSAKSAFNSFMQSIISSLQKKVTEKFITPVLDSAMASFFGAGGGRVHLAAGGQATMHRDRVPAMLEPGEFVIRKPMAKAIGGPALHAMNGTGKGLTPNIEVVVNNQGTPKDAQANVKPQIDVNKMVVEIVTSDIRNNGPIRKSLRGNA